MGPGGIWRPGHLGVQPGTTPGWMWGLAIGVRWLTMAAFWGALVAGLVLTVRWVSGVSAQTTTPETPKDILKRRYARGEIDQPTFERMMREVE
jgi:putative membrane protein